MSLSIQLLGGFQIRLSTGAVVDLPQPRLQLLAAYLFLHRESAQLRSRPAFLFWPDSTEGQARTNLRKLLHTLRTSIPQIEPCLQLTTETIHWQPSPECSLDVARFEAALNAARATQSESERCSQLAQAIDLYGGVLLPGHFDEWVLAAREALHLAYMNALAELAGLYERADRLVDAVQIARKLLQADPLQESTYRTLMHLHIERGEPARAMRVFHDCASLLAQELGVDPAEETQALYDQILHRERRAQQRAPARRVDSEIIGLVGRREEQSLLRQIWQTARQGGAQLVVIQGEPGIGKTRLAEEIIDLVRKQGYSTLYARAYAAEGRAAYGPTADLLRDGETLDAIRQLKPLWQEELVRILPELIPDQAYMPTPMTESWQLRRFHEALARACLAVGQPLAIHLDDLQWFDAETLAWLHFLLRFQSNEPSLQLLVVGTLRTTEVSAEHPYQNFRNAYLQSGALHEIFLDPLSTQEVAELSAAIAGSKVDKGSLHALYGITEGNPLFVLEALRAAEYTESFAPRAEGHPAELTAIWPESTPKVHAVIQSRLAHLTPVARQVIRIAAVIGRQFTYELLYAVHIDSDFADPVSEAELIAALDELWQRRVIREHGPQAYDFGHDRIRETVYAEIGPALRRRWHGQIAATLEALHTTDLSAVSSRIGAHYEAAGKPVQAATYYRRAAQYAAERFAQDEAIRALQHALALLPASDQHGHYELRILLEDILAPAGMPTERYENLQILTTLAGELRAAAHRADAAEGAVAAACSLQAEVFIRLAHYYSATGSMAACGEAARRAVQLAEAGDDPGVLAKAMGTLGWAYHWTVGELDDARRELTKGVDLAHRLGHDILEAILLEQLAATGMYSGLDIDTILSILRQAYDIHLAHNNLFNQASISNKFGYAIFSQGEANYHEGIGHYRQALEIARRLGATSLEANLLNNLGLAYLFSGDYQQAELYLLQGPAAAKESGSGLHEAIGMGFLAELRASQGRLQEACECCHASLHIFEAYGAEHRRTETLCILGLVLYLQRDFA